jgi:hypothetical protein
MTLGGPRVFASTSISDKIRLKEGSSTSIGKKLFLISNRAGCIRWDGTIGVRASF